MATAARKTTPRWERSSPSAASSRSRSTPAPTSTSWCSRDDERRQDPDRVARSRGAENWEIVNLGIGIPNLVPGLLGDGATVFLHTENGLLGVGPRPGEDELDPDLIDAAKQPVTAPRRRVLRQRAELRDDPGGHVDVAVLGALQVSIAGDIANWAVREGRVGVGGAMDLVVGARRVIDHDRNVVGGRAEDRRRVHLS